MNILFTILVSCLKKILSEIKIFINHKKSEIKWFLKPVEKTKIHLGSGPNNLTNFINIDLIRDADFQFDLRRKLPFKANSIEYVFSEHTIEHFSYPDEIEWVFFQVSKCLKVGGFFDFSIPDYTKLFKSYYCSNKERKIFNLYMNDYKKRGHNPKWQTPNDFLDLLIRQEGEHKYLYDLDTIKKIGLQAGFTSIRKRKKNDYDSQERKEFSLFIRAQKKY